MLQRMKMIDGMAASKQLTLNSSEGIPVSFLFGGVRIKSKLDDAHIIRKSPSKRTFLYELKNYLSIIGS